ncbi:hypothetical protein PRIC2_013655 [Phytophthora ramorum]
MTNWQRKPDRRALKDVTSFFGVHKRTIVRLWKRAKVNVVQHGIYEAPLLKHRSGRRPRDLAAMLQRFHHVDLQRRTTIRAAVASGVPSTTLFRCLKQAKLRSYKNVTRPMLTVDSLKARIKFCLADTSINKYRDMMDMVHVDHKYFFLTVVKRRFIILHDEPEPARKLKKKRHILKVMMLAAVARLRYNAAGECIFDGKLGTWAFVEHTLAQRTSRNQVAGTPLVKAITATKENYREVLLGKLLSATKSKWPGEGRGVRITVQQDNASPISTPRTQSVAPLSVHLVLTCTKFSTAEQP